MLSSKSFSLIELLVVVAVFALIFAIAAGLFATAIKNQRNLLARQEVMDEISYVMEYMSRAIRMAKYDEASGANYQITTTGNGGLKFKNYNNLFQEFYLETSTKRLKEIKTTSNYLTSDNLQIISFNINLIGETRAVGDPQPKVTLFLDIQHKKQTEVKLQIQTTISQRNLDI